MDKIQFRMSSAGKCPRALSAELLECPCEPKPTWLDKTAEEGNWHEKRIKDELIARGYQVFDEQLELSLGNNYIELTGHIDGKVYTPDKVKQLLEIKSMSQFQFDKWMRVGFDGFPEYLAQIACYFEATQLPECLYVVKNRNSGYVDTRIIKPIQGYIDDIINHLTEVADSVAEKELFPAEFNSDSVECRRCGYKLLCIPKITVMDIATREQLDLAVAEIRDGNKLLAEGKELYDRGKSKLYKHTVASELKKWQHNELAVQLISVKEQTTYPKESLLKKYTIEELAGIAKVKDGYSCLRIDDLEKDND